MKKQEDSCDNIAEYNPESPLLKQEETDLTSNAPTNFHPSLMNASTNFNAFPTNMLEVHRILATHMLMMEKHRRLYLPTSETRDDNSMEADPTKETETSSDNLKKEDTMSHIFNFKSRSRKAPQSLIGCNPYRSSFQPVGKDTVEGDRKVYLEYAKCYLETKELWEKFHRLGTEMIITKTGR